MNWDSSLKIFPLKLKQPKELDSFVFDSISQIRSVFRIPFDGTDVSARRSLMLGSRSARLAAVISASVLSTELYYKSPVYFSLKEGIGTNLSSKPVRKKATNIT